jgi:hypothetical protein
MIVGDLIAYGDKTVAYTVFRDGFMIVGKKTMQHTQNRCFFLVIGTVLTCCLKNGCLCFKML